MAERSQLQRDLAATYYANGGRVQACERRVETDGKAPDGQHERDFTAEWFASAGIADLAAVRQVADVIPALYAERRQPPGPRSPQSNPAKAWHAPRRSCE